MGRPPLEARVGHTRYLKARVARSLTRALHPPAFQSSRLFPHGWIFSCLGLPVLVEILAV